jgi:nitrate reductase gamma subunit
VSVEVLTYIALAAFLVGLAYKVSTWFRYTLGVEARDIPPSGRLTAALRGILSTALTKQSVLVLKALVLDVFLQKRILDESHLRWLMHMCIYAAFTLLVLFHALGDVITTRLFSDYYPTLNPFLFLRDLFGAVVIVGVCIAAYRRYLQKGTRLRTIASDHYAIGIVAVIVVSGLVLESTKIGSHAVFVQMVEEYGYGTGDPSFQPLEAYWEAEFGVVPPNAGAPHEAQFLAQGRAAHEESCADCHARPQWGFLGYGLARILRPAAPTLDRAHAVAVVWHLHVLACLLALAYLPFSKMFHLLATHP